MDNLFPALPESISDPNVTVEELSALLDEFRAAARGIKDGTTDLSSFANADDVVEQYRQGVVAIRQIETELAERASGVENFATVLAEIDEGVDLGDVEPVVEVTEELAAETDEPEPDPDEPDPDPEVVEETVVASGARRLALPAAVAKQHRPMIAELEEAAASFVSATGISGVIGGTRLDRRGLAEAFISARGQHSSLPEGFEDRMAVATMDYSHMFPAERRLDGDDLAGTMGKIDAIFQRQEYENLVASGGLCAPYTNFYNVVSYGSSARPVRDALVSFNAVRGGVNVPGGISIADIDDGVGIVTAAQDEAGGTAGTKTCLVISCPSYTPTAIEAIYACIEFGNLNSRAWPELVERFLNELDTQHARVAETELLDGIAAASVTVTRALQYSGMSTILAGLLQAVPAYKQRLRMDDSATWDLFLPDTLPALLLNDLINQQHGRWDVTTPARVTQLIEQIAGVNVTYYKDVPTDASTGAFPTAFEADNDALDAHPDHAFGYLFPRGTFIHLDMGELNLGLVRDSSLNATNDYQMFRETFENVAFVGIRSVEINFTLTHSGELAPLGTYAA